MARFGFADWWSGTQVDDGGRPAYIPKFTPSDTSGGAFPSGSSTSPMYVLPQQNTYPLASNATLASGATIGLTNGIVAATYVYAYQFGGTAPSLVLESLGPDGVNFQTIATVSAGGTQGVVLGTNSTVQLRNAGANTITGLSANLS